MGLGSKIARTYNDNPMNNTVIYEANFLNVKLMENTSSS